MAVAADATDFLCPGCTTRLEPQQGDREVCSSCGWTGSVMLFRPVDLHVDEAEEALPEDAVCVHHPTKRAVAVCSGTGDYICSLCSIEVEGQTFSAAFLNTKGKKQTRKMFDRYLARPDSTVVLFLLLCIFPGVNVYWALGTPVWLPLGFMKLAGARRLRRENPLMSRLISPARLVLLSVLLTLFAILIVIFVILMVVGVFVS